MKKIKSYSKYLSDSEFEKQYAEAVKSGEEEMRLQPHAKSVRYEKRNRRVRVELQNDCVFIFPPDLVQGLANAPDDALADCRVLGVGSTLEWSTLDQHYSIAGLMQGIFGNRAWMAELRRESGQTRSENKNATSPKKVTLRAIKRERVKAPKNISGKEESSRTRRKISA
jgi:hypothetical protein